MSTGPASIRLPLAHRVARRLAAGGLVGASWYWRAARLLATVPPTGVVVLSDGTPIVHDPTDWTCRMSYEGTYEREILRLLPELLGAGDIGERGRVVRHADLLRVALVEAVTWSTQWNFLFRQR